MALILQQLLESGQNVPTSEFKQPQHRSLVEAVQERLCRLGLLDPVISGSKEVPFGPVKEYDGIAGPETDNAIAAFHRYARLPEAEGLLRPAFFGALAQADPDELFPVVYEIQPNDGPQVRFAKRILSYMRKKNYWIARAPDTCNIVYVEGVDTIGRPNANQLDEWDDRRCVIKVNQNGEPVMLVNDQATTEPGHFYTMQPMNALGAARLAFGQYKAFPDGIHRNRQPALVQQGSVRLHRDIAKSGRRNPDDRIEVGRHFGINQHSTAPDIVPEQISKFSAGCLVGRRFDYHLSFMHIIRQDYRYTYNRRYRFMTTLIDGVDLFQSEPI